jgi:thioesterase domain-containing protein
MAQQLSRQGHSVGNLLLLDTAAPALNRTSHSQSLRKRWRGVPAWIKTLPDRTQEVPSIAKPITSYIRSGLFLLAASSKRDTTSSDGKPALSSLLGWAGLDTWRALLLQGETEIANTVSQETSLLLIKMPAVTRVLELVREHRRLVLRYTAEKYDGKITLFRAVASGSRQKVSTDPTLGWGTLAQNGVEVRTIRANHVALFVNPHVKVLAHELMKCLNRK